MLLSERPLGTPILSAVRADADNGFEQHNLLLIANVSGH
jgi:hypothetical protein